MVTRRGEIRIVDGPPQRTIGAEVDLRGRGGFFDGELVLRLLPASVGTGVIVRHRKSEARLGASLLEPDPRFRHTTCVRTPAGLVRSVEHLLAALSSFGITNVVIESDDSGHMPFFDGSAAAFCEAVLRAGVVEQPGAVAAIEVVRPYECTIGSSWMSIGPCLNGVPLLTLDVEIEFAFPIGRQRLQYKHEALDFVLRLAGARTFLSVPWIGGAIAGFPGFFYDEGTDRRTNMVTHDGLRFHVALRAPDECARHKTLDLLGDLAVLGVPILGHIVARRPGHALTHAIVRAIGGSLSLQSEQTASGF